MFYLTVLLIGLSLAPSLASREQFESAGFRLNSHKEYPKYDLKYYPCTEYAPPQSLLNVNFNPSHNSPEENCEASAKMFLSSHIDVHYNMKCKLGNPVGGPVNRRLNKGVAYQEYSVPLGVTLLGNKDCTNFYFGQLPHAKMLSPHVDRDGNCAALLVGVGKMGEVTTTVESEEKTEAIAKDSTTTTTDIAESSGKVGTSESFYSFDYLLECECLCEVQRLAPLHRHHPMAPAPQRYPPSHPPPHHPPHQTPPQYRHPFPQPHERMYDGSHHVHQGEHYHRSVPGQYRIESDSYRPPPHEVPSPWWLS